MKTFAAEASLRLGGVLEALGFTGPEDVPSRDRYPLQITVRYRRSDAVVETRLTLGYMGEHDVHTSLLWIDDDCKVEVGTTTAHTGYQMRRGLDIHARAVPALLQAGPP
ncbi:hypothetical protein ACFPK5_07670 [Streptomyces beijiangensis]|uniref:hypothetical protein n=1 Tax=Streptomyces beijiangensis TaxID=163361 RepID=UPI003617AC04